jgi:hypothetical protein
MWVLKTYNSAPPGSYHYEQTDEIRHSFKQRPVIEDLAKAVSNFRIGNKLRRASLGESLEDIDTFICGQLKNNPQFCRETDSTFTEARSTHPFFQANCPTCGTPVKPT